MSVVLDATDATDTWEGFLAAAVSRTPCAVLDPTWPLRMRRRCASQVAQAIRDGDVGADDLVLFTSGSSSAPRAVVRTRRSWTDSFPALTDRLALTCRDVVWLPGPLSSTLYLFGAAHAEHVGASLVFGADPLSRDTGATPALQRVSVAHAVPALLPSIVAARTAGTLPRLRTIVVAGDRVPEAHRAALQGSGVDVVEYYGAAELSIVGVRGDDAVMTAFPGVQTRVRDGVLWCRTPFAARGYLNDHDGVGGALQRDGDGWLSVGDRARRCGRDGFEVLGRGSGAVTVGGHTVLVEDVETVLRSLPGVQDAAVGALAQPRLGAQLVALVAGPAPVAALRQGTACLPRQARPRRFLKVHTIPRHSSGKVSRQDVRVLIERAGSGDDVE